MYFRLFTLISTIVLSSFVIKTVEVKCIYHLINNIPKPVSEICNYLHKVNIDYDIEMIGTYGQSLAVGGGASNKSTDFKNTITFLSGSSLYGIPFLTKEEKNSYFGSNFVNIGYQSEQYPPATASLTSVLQLIELENNIDIENYNYQFIPQTGGKSGNSITKMNKGTNIYSNYLECITKANEFASNEGKSFAFRTLCWVQGEADRYKTYEEYYSLLSSFFKDINNDIKKITKQKEDVIFISYQTSPWLGRVVSGKLMSNINIQEVQVDICNQFENVYSCGAMYQFEYGDDYHPKDRAIIGLQQGVAIKRLIYDNKDWKTFQPISHKIIKGDNKYFIHLKFEAPVLPIRFDISGDIWHNPRGKQLNYGFEVLKDNVEMQIEEPFITLDNTVVLTTNENPQGMKIRYAVNGHDGGGNLCDSQNITVHNKEIDYIIDNFAVAFSNYIID